MKTLVQAGIHRSCSLTLNRPGGTAWRWMVGILAVLLFAITAACQTRTLHRPCAAVTLRGQVFSGESYTHAITPGLDFKLEAVPAGWMMRVLPHAGARPPHDYAELASPPYRSPTPLLISTDFAFRAQDAIAWNPRTFRYFRNRSDLQIADVAYREVQNGTAMSASAERLFAILPRASEATLTILDAEISGETANQAPGAAAVASHFAETAHHVRSIDAPTPLGKLHRLAFQVAFPEGACRTASSRR